MRRRDRSQLSHKFTARVQFGGGGGFPDVPRYSAGDITAGSAGKNACKNSKKRKKSCFGILKKM